MGEAPLSAARLTFRPRPSRLPLPAPHSLRAAIFHLHGNRRCRREGARPLSPALSMTLEDRAAGSNPRPARFVSPPSLLRLQNPRGVPPGGNNPEFWATEAA